LSGEPLELFVDCDSIAWGQEWQKRINSSLIQTTFFIPIISSRYFKRPECRRELLEFSAKVTSLGAAELLLPIIYIETQDLSVESQDEAVALVARTQYEDWHNIRLLEPNSREYRTAVNKLASRLLEIAGSVAESQLKRELNSSPSDDGVDGITDIVEQIKTLLPDWLNAVLDEKTNLAQAEATWEEYRGQYRRAQKRKAPPSALLATRIRMAKEMLPLLERGLKDARVYLARSIELDPLISALTRILAEHREAMPLIFPIREAIGEAMVEIRKQDAKIVSETPFLSDYFSELVHLGRIFQQGRSVALEHLRYINEGNDIVRRWDSELSRLDQPQSCLDQPQS
jgi:hypothetical protein